MEFDKPLIKGHIIKRYKRFFIDVRLSDNSIVTAHCPNTGSMLGISSEGLECYLSQKDNPRAKLKYGLEIVNDGTTLVGANTMMSNRLVKEAIEKNLIPELSGYSSIKREVKYGKQNSKIDFLLENNNKESCYLEVKNVHLKRKDGLAEFPDAKTERGAKHLEELIWCKKQGFRAVILYIVQRSDCYSFKVAQDIDKNYYEKSLLAKKNGVEIITYGCIINPKYIIINGKLIVD